MEGELDKGQGKYATTEFGSLESPGNLAEHTQNLLNLMQSDDDMDVLTAVMQLSMHLAVAPEESFSSFPMEQTIATLVECLHRDLPDISLYAIISLNHIMDTVTNSIAMMANAGGVAALSMKLMSFEYIDMAEHAIKALERLSYDNSTSVLKEGAFSAMINMMDFFEQETQKRILSIAGIIARAVASEELMTEYILPVVPVISTLLQYKGNPYFPMNQLGLHFFSGISESIIRLSGGDPEVIKRFAEIYSDNGVFQNLLELLPNATGFQSRVLKLIRFFCDSSPNLVLMFHNYGGVSMIKEALDIGEKENDEGLRSYSMEALALVDVLIPIKESQDPLDLELVNMYMNNPEFMRSLGEVVMPRILTIYERITNRNNGHLILHVMGKILALSDHDFVETYVTPVQFSTFISEILSCKDSEAIKSVLSIVVVLYNKIPQQVAENFVREGVISKIRALQIEDALKDLKYPVQVFQEILATTPSTNLRQALLRSGMSRDPKVLEQILAEIKKTHRTKKRSATIDAQSEPDEPLLRRKMTEPDVPDTVKEAAKEILCLTHEALTKHSVFDNPDYQSVLAELKDLGRDLETVEGESGKQFLGRFIDLLNSDKGISLHELDQSNFLDSLWKFLSPNKSSLTILHRIHEFLVTIMKNNQKGENNLTRLISLLLRFIRYTQQFPTIIYEANGASSSFTAMRTLSNRARVTLVYDAERYEQLSSESKFELEAKHQLFLNIGQLALSLEQYHSLETISEALLKVKSQQNLNLFLASFERTSAEMRGINQGQLNMTKQHLRMQQLLSESMDLTATLEEMGIRSEGNEQLIKEIQGQKVQQFLDGLQAEENKGEEDQEQDQDQDQDPEAQNIQPIEAMTISHRKESVLDPKKMRVVMRVGDSEVNKRTTLYEINSKYVNENEGIVIKFSFDTMNDQNEEESTYLSSSTNILDEIINSAINIQSDKDEKVYAPLKLLKFLHTLSSKIHQLLSPSSPLFYFPIDPISFTQFSHNIFISHKLSAILARQVSDVLAMAGGTAPDWVKNLPKKATFLFNFLQRYDLFRAIGFGGGRSLYFYSNRGKNFTVRMLRQKAMIPRDQIIEAGMRVLSDSALLKFGMLEFDFSGEEGTGIGPTLEFYALASKELRKLDIWRNTGEECGLFPAPLQSQNLVRISETFYFIGKLVAKALYDDRLIDLPISAVFWKLVMKKPLTLIDLLQVDPGVGRYMLQLQEIVNKWKWAQHECSDSDYQKGQMKEITLNGTPIEELYLSFTLPGYDDIELKPHGKDKIVTLDTLEEYINLVAHYTLMQSYQAQAFRKGLEKLIPVEALEVFEPEELENVICGKGNESWDISVLEEAIVTAHGYDKKSKVYQNLLKIMTSLDMNERRLFLQFVTGCPRLPIGGFKALHPPLTVVRKDPTVPGTNPDDVLPSVMTCQNYLKIPEYSSYEVFNNQLRYALKEGHEAFHLS
ncbi:UPL4_4 [Blepharisma stoltei]|uniref:HECT-type E3 ubiquitin transferase n=1 Tax=Blepharisma stoltei TaxID=1481888 RepID=A0AAU9K607_9CILI|nr:unnamed protein product [Blepharisma stoltei]